MNWKDTVVAISTPLGEGGIGIIRISGPLALKTASRIIELPQGDNLEKVPSHTIKLSHLINPNTKERLDQVLVSVMRAPRTYTREDVVEINCHGGMVPLQVGLEAAIEAGARLAEPGEFTKRAFLNGRIDLAQAEAVVDIIRSKTEESLRIAMGQLNGRISLKAKEIRQEISEVLVQIEASIDFIDEDLEIMSPKEIAARLERVRRKLARLIGSAQAGRVYREGAKVAIAGRPNVGKSSLLNGLVQKDRVIVTPIPGTTRDVVEEIININGIPFRLRDTAGIRAPSNEVEKLGVEMSRKEIKEADVVLLVLDASQPLTTEDLKVAKGDKDKAGKTIVVLNKIDLPLKIDERAVAKHFREKIIKTSATEEKGLKNLEKAMVDLVLSGEVALNGEVIVANVRHKRALEKAEADLQEARSIIQKAIPQEFVAAVLHDALDSMGEITGETVQDELLDKIFSQFCIGK